MSYDKNGLGITEITYLALKWPTLSLGVFWLIDHHLEGIGLKCARLIIDGKGVGK